jgi:hypothetical protein
MTLFIIVQIPELLPSMLYLVYYVQEAHFSSDCMTQTPHYANMVYLGFYSVSALSVIVDGKVCIPPRRKCLC